MTMLKSGWVIVGSTPSTDGTTRTKGDGCLLVLDANGKLVATWSGPDINDPWGNMAVIDNGTTATLFVSMAGFDVPGPEVLDPATGFPVIINKATVLRLELSIPDGKPPVIAEPDRGRRRLRASAPTSDDFLIGPTGSGARRRTTRSTCPTRWTTDHRRSPTPPRAPTAPAPAAW